MFQELVCRLKSPVDSARLSAAENYFALEAEAQVHNRHVMLGRALFTMKTGTQAQHLNALNPRATSIRMNKWLL